MYNLLLVDDEALIRKGIKKLIDFEKLNISNVYEAEDGIEALEIFKTHDIDMAIIDINMPNMDGLTLSCEMKKINEKVKITILTGYDYFDYAKKAISLGVNDYILKPVSKDDIFEIILKMKNMLQKENKDKKIAEIISHKVKEIDLDANHAKKIKSILEEKLNDTQFNLNALADELNLSSSYLSVLFKKIFGVTFQSYITDKRLEKAKILLLTTDMKNHEISKKIGFSDTNYFVLKFKQYYKKSPKKYKSDVENKEGLNEEQK